MRESIDKAYLKSEGGFEDLYHTYFDRAMRTAKIIMQDEHLAADAVQETFLRVYKHIESYDDTKSFSAWFNTILINECKRGLKKSNKVTYIEAYQDEQLITQECKEQWERQETLKAVLDELEEGMKIPIILKYIQDLKITEIAEIMSLNVNTVKSRLLVARNKLRKIYTKWDKEVQ
ncbi:MAG: RNA polymerase sigma factor [Candidatus Niameybacter stercoravium]|nr:RNA polymerase sigma factor [Candidatus Niameybacter stercoravium]